MPKTDDNIELDFFLIAEKILAFASHPNIVRKVKLCLPILSKLRDDVLRY